MAIPEEDERAPSVAASRQSKALSQVSKATSRPNGKVPSVASQKPPSATGSRTSILRQQQDGERTPTASHPHSPNEHELNQEEARIVRDALAGRTPRTSYYAASLEPEVANHYHDMELCVLLHQENDPTAHEFVKKALRKAVRQRVKKLGMKYDNEVGTFTHFGVVAGLLIFCVMFEQSIRQYRKSFHDHDPSVHLHPEHGLNVSLFAPLQGSLV